MTNSRIGLQYRVCIRWYSKGDAPYRTDYRIFLNQQVDFHEFANESNANRYWDTRTPLKGYRDMAEAVFSKEYID